MSFEVDKDINGNTAFVSVGNVVDAKVDALILPEFTNSSSEGGVGRDVIRRGGMPALEAYDAHIAQNGKQKLGSAFLSAAGRLPIPHVIHTTSVIGWGDAESDKRDNLQFTVVHEAFANALKIANDTPGINSISVPMMGTGLMGDLTVKQSAEAMLSALDGYKGKPLRVEFVIWAGGAPGKDFVDFTGVLRNDSYKTAGTAQKSAGEIGTDAERSKRDFDVGLRHLPKN